MYVIDVMKFRDIKCENLLIDSDGIIKLMDFGTLKKFSLDQKSETSAYWMSPELINNRIISPKGDIWALGGCVIEMLRGNPPYSNEYNED